MERNEFKSRLKQYKKAREENPGLKYWEWKAIPKYDEGTGGVTLKEKEDAFWRGDTQKMAELVEREGKQLTYVTPQSNMDEVVITANKPKQNRYSELDFAKDIAGFVPVLGDAVDIYDVGKSLYNGNYSQAALLGAGLLLPNWLERGGKFLYKSIKNKRLANQFSKILDNTELNKTDLPVSTKTIQFEPVVRPNGPYVDYQMADMRNFLKTRFNKWTKHYGYDPVPLDLSIQESLEQMKDRIIAHNTFVRGVRDPKQEMDFYIKNDPFNERAELMRQAYLNTVQSLDELNLPNTAENRMKVAASQLVGQTGHGRAGMGYNSTKGSLYTSNSLNTAGGYASYGKTAAGKVFKVQRPVDFSGDYHDWLLKGDFPLFNNSTLKRFADDSYFFQDLPYLLKTGRSLKTDALQKANVFDFNYETWLNDKLNRIKTNIQNQFPKEYNDVLRQVDDQFENVYPGLNRFYKRSIDPNDIIETAARKAALDALDYSLPSKLSSNPRYLKTRFDGSKNMYFGTYLNTKKKLIRGTSPQFAKKQHYGKMMNSSEYKNAIRELLEENGINYTTYNSNGAYDGIFTTERKHHPKKGDNAYQHFIFVGNPGNYPVNIIDEISPDIWQIYNSGTRAHVGESFKGLSRKSYAEGGQVEPHKHSERPVIDFDPETGKTTYGYNPGAGYLSGTDPIGEAMMWGLGGGAASAALRSMFPTYGATAGWLAFGDNNKDNMLVIPNNPVKNTTPIETGLLNKEVRQYYADDVLPRDILTSEADKLRFLNTDKNFEYDLYPSDYFKENVAGHYDPYADKIRLNGGYAANKDLLDNVMSHEVNHRYNREFPLDKEHNRILNRAYTVEPDLDTPAARAARKLSEKRATNVNIRHKLQTDLRDTLGHNPTKAEMDKFIDSLSDQELLDRLGSASSYGSAYLMSIEDRADLVNQPADQYKKARTTALRKALKRIAMNENKNGNNQNYA